MVEKLYQYSCCTAFALQLFSLSGLFLSRRVEIGGEVCYHNIQYEASTAIRLWEN